jgi:two-component system, OmpR family, phosphate regulon sensor histidine kinase PhoR
MRLHHKLFLAFGSIMAATLIVVFIYLDHNLNTNNLIQLKETIKRQTLISKSLLLKLDGQKYSKEDIAHDIGTSLNLRVTIISSDGKVLGDSDIDERSLNKLENHLGRAEVQDATKFGEGWSQRFSTTLKKEVLYYAVPVKSPSFNGFIRLAIPVERVSLMSHNIDGVLFVSLAIAFMAALLAALIVFNVISKPIRDLAKKAQEIANGNFSNKLSINKKDEVGELAIALNSMGENIRERINEILNNNSKFEAVLLSMFDGIMVIDPNGTIQLINDTLMDLLEIKGNPVGKKPIEVIRNTQVQDIAESVLNMTSGVITKEENLIFPQAKTLLIHATPVARGGKTLGAVIVFNDITELRRLETIRKDFVANVSHELRTPVSNIKGYTETLLDGAIDDKKHATDFVKIIHAESERLALLINDILDLSKIESDVFKLNIKQHHLYELINRAWTKLQKDAKDKSMILENKVSPELVINLDDNLMTQVFMNLIHNAIKYSPENSKIIVSASKQNDLLRVDVQDQGMGIPEKDLPRIFERFYRVDKARSKELGGTGLGLAIVKHIVQTHGGEVSVKSTEGHGSTFSFTIPR